MSRTKSTKANTDEVSNKCSRCIGKCCRYALIDLPAPRSRLDFDNYCWYLAHEHTVIYVDSKKWYLAVNTKCRYLNDKNLCDIYEKRFQACRDHTDENCEFDGKYEPDLIFTDPFKLLKYAEKRFKKMGRKKTGRKISFKKK